jgi:hypothetical protein
VILSVFSWFSPVFVRVVFDVADRISEALKKPEKGYPVRSHMP